LIVLPNTGGAAALSTAGQLRVAVAETELAAFGHFLSADKSAKID
jgi:hypothetical protein